MGKPCEQKVRYTTQAKARRAARRARFGAYEYLCDECGYYHIASAWRRRLSRRIRQTREDLK